VPHFEAYWLFRLEGRKQREDVIPFLEMCCADATFARSACLQWPNTTITLTPQPINDQKPAIDRRATGSGQHAHLLGQSKWHPLLAGTIRQMREDGIRRAVAFTTSPSDLIRGAASTAKIFNARARRWVKALPKS